MTEPFPISAVVRVSRGSFDPGKFADVAAANKSTSRYLIPAIQRLAGLIHYYVGLSPDGSLVHVSIWDSDAHAAQMSTLTEMIVVARAEMEAAGVTFSPIVNYQVSWTV